MRLEDAFTRTGRIKRGILAKSEDAKQTKQETVAELLARKGIRLRNLDAGQQKPLMPGGRRRGQT